jgi:hypothetical protein
MADMALQRHIGDYIDVKAASLSLAWTAGGASDSATWTGLTIDRGSAFSTGAFPRTADFDVVYDATLGSGHTLSLYFDLKSAPDGATWTDFATEASVVVATGPSGGGRVAGVARMTLVTPDDPTVAAQVNIPGQTTAPSIDLTSAQRYLQFNTIPHLSATGTDTAVIQAVGVFAGFDSLQAPSN